MVQTTHAKRTRLACDSCRRQRRKCDRKAPACSSCEKRNEVCVYDPTVDQRSPEQRDYVAALEARVALLEGVLRDGGAREAAGPSGLESTDEGDSAPAMRAIAPPPMASTQPDPSLEPKTALEPELGFVPSDDAAQALAPIAHPSPEELNTAASDELDLGMGGYVPLVSLDMELKLLAEFWDWQYLHCPYVAPAPFLSVYALYTQVAHPGEPIPSSPFPPTSANPLAGSRTMNVPSPESVHADPELAQFISPLLLDAMFVIGAIFYGDAEMSNQFYKRAEARVMGEAAKPRLATVQGVMLMAKAELGHARAPTAWTLNGVTVALCVRLGMHVDATPLVRCGTMSKTLFETRNFVFWTIYNNDRFYGICLGMNPLMDRRIISTPRHSSLAANVVKPDVSVAGPSSKHAEKPTASGVGTTWWSPATLGMGDVVVQAGWEAIRDLARIMDMLIDGIYAFDAPIRTPQEDLELVARNNLTIQRFLDDLPAWLRSTDGMRVKYNGIIYLHLFTHLVSILACRPFLSPRPLSEDSMRLNAATDISQPSHSSHIIRRYRTLAFRIARASALQITSLVRHIPLSSPCISNSFIIYTACTILLLVPDDTAAMNGVRTGLACLENMCEAGYWLNSMNDGKERILALAKRWGVDIGQGKKVNEPVLGGRGGGGSGTGGPTKDEDAGTESNDAGSSGTNGGAQKPLGSSSGACSTLESETGIGSRATRLSASTVTYGKRAESGATYSYAQSGWTQQYGESSLDQTYADQAYLDGIAPTANHAYAAPLPQESDISNLGARYTTVTHNYDTWEWTRVSCSYASGMVYSNGPKNGPAYAPQQQPHFPTPVRFDTQTYSVQYHNFSQTSSSIIDYERQVRHRRGLASAPQEQVYPQQSHYQQQYRQPLIQQQPQTQYHPQVQYQPQQYQPHPPTQRHHIPAPPAPLPHATYTLPHADAVQDSHLSHTHRPQVLPSADPNFSLPLDPVAYTDLAECFADTIQMTQEPAFLKTMENPYAGVADVIFSFPVTTMDAYAGVGVAGSSVGMGAATATPFSGGVSGVYAQGPESGGYGYKHPAVGYAGEGSVGGWVI
ncbi:hypothetical protein BDV93DRAFT_250583 [Ceratobasidium sp. AG-I]|nr:hypothetical protein BDV93DRAFT_250583 [Ceratobasidium sp. AG-I]